MLGTARGAWSAEIADDFFRSFCFSFTFSELTLLFAELRFSFPNAETIQLFERNHKTINANAVTA